MVEYKGYGIINDVAGPLKRIKAIGRGSTHLSLRGYYTSLKEAQKAIDLFLVQKGGTDD